MNKGVYILLGLVLVVLAAGMLVLKRIDDSVDTLPPASGDAVSLAGEAGSDSGSKSVPNRTLSELPPLPGVYSDPSAGSGSGPQKGLPSAAASTTGSSSPAGGTGAKDANGNPVPQTHSLFSHVMAPLALNFEKGPFQVRADGRVLKTDTATRAEGLNKEGVSVEEDIEVIGSIIDQYRKIFGSNPIAGENRDLVLALTGDNPHKLALIDPSSPAINDQGELVDRWGTPFRFHPVDSRQPMEIFSAGPDTKFATPDDIQIGDPVIYGDGDLQLSL